MVSSSFMHASIIDSNSLGISGINMAFIMKLTIIASLLGLFTIADSII